MSYEHRNPPTGSKAITSGFESKVFDPLDPATGSGGAELSDACVVKRGNQWWMYLAGQAKGYGATDLYSASLPPDAPLSAQGWTLTRETDGNLKPLAGRSRSHTWDGKGGRHCSSYVCGWDTREGKWVERVYYAGSAENLWGPYTIGFLQWNGEEWVDQAVPAFVAEEEWEHRSVYEPNLIYDDDRWKMWFVAGSNHEDYLVHGYAESRDGRTGWSKHEIFAPPEMKMFDFCVRKGNGVFDAVFARVWMGKTLPRQTLGYGGAELRIRPTSSPSGALRSKFKLQRIAVGILVPGNRPCNSTDTREHARSYFSTAPIEPRSRALSIRFHSWLS